MFFKCKGKKKTIHFQFHNVCTLAGFKRMIRHSQNPVKFSVEPTELYTAEAQ